MKFIPTPLQNAYLIEIEPIQDSRGFFARTFCVKEFQKHGLETQFIQFNLSHNKKKGTLRGMHYQLPPSDEVKLVRCIRGSIYDVILDIREASPTFGKWFGAELTEENRKMMYVPKGFAHGFITLEPDSEVFYSVTNSHDPARERGLRWDDANFNISWPIPPAEMSEKDRNHSEFYPPLHLVPEGS